MKVSVIVSVYKDTEALGLILESLSKQTFKDFEIIISEDGNSNKMQEFLKKHENIKHVYQEDKGWRKNIALNNAVKNALGEYLIFIDGDVIPYLDFVKQHIESKEPKKILMGKRIELGKYFTKMLRNRIISSVVLEKMFLPLLPFIILDKGSRHIEDGVILKKGNRFGDKIRNKKRKMIVGCNFSCYKSDLEKINGFDEDYTKPSVGEDVDLMWRFEHIGVEIKSVRNLANIFHLWHLRRWDEKTVKENNILLEQKQANSEYICKNGLIN